MSQLNSHVLVLNHSWQAVQVVSVRAALIMLCKGVARVIDVNDFQMLSWEDWSKMPPGDGDRALKSVNCSFRVPEVVTLSEYDRLPRRGVVFSRRSVHKRDNWRCQYCGVAPGSEELTLDHVLPRSRGGTSCFENVVTCCVRCNSTKAARTPEECGMRLLSKPVRPSWSPQYANPRVRLDSWSKFVSESYWSVPLEE